MLPKKKLDKISETVMRAALASWNKGRNEFDFELRGEICKARVNDTWGDGCELSIRIMIGENDLNVSGFYYKESDRIDHIEPTGKRVMAEKFI